MGRNEKGRRVKERGEEGWRGEGKEGEGREGKRRQLRMYNPTGKKRNARESENGNRQQYQIPLEKLKTEKND